MTSTEREQRLAQTFVALSNTLVDDFDVLDFLSLLAERSAELLNVTAAGVVLSDQRGSYHPTAASTEDAHLLELLSAKTQEGPCLEALRTGSPSASSDLTTATERWPTFTGAAIDAGFHAVYAVPMCLNRECIGALTLLNTSKGEIDTASTQLGQALADVATLGILQHRSARHRELVSEQLQATLHHRVVVEQAKGFLAETGNVSMRQAFELLRDYSRSNGQRLSDLARSIVDRTVAADDLLIQVTVDLDGEAAFKPRN